MIPCPSCCVCTIDSDTFDGALSKWTQDAGSWSTSGGLLTHTGTSGKITLNAAASSASQRTITTTYPYTASGTAVWRLKACWLDADNYLFGELSYSGGSGTIRIGRRRAGVETWLADAVTITPVTRPTVSLCWRPGQPISQYSGAVLVVAGDGDSTESPTWTNPENITADDDSYASYIFSAINEVTGALEANTFPLAIPLGATIDNVAVGCLARSNDATHEIVDDAINLVFTSFTTGSSTITFGSQQVPTSEGALDWEGTAAEWGVEASTPEDWNSGLTVALEFQIGTDPDPPNNSPLQVEMVAVEVAFTSAPRSAGRLEFKYESTCVSASGVYGEEGKQTGMEVVSGVWDFTEFSYQYAESTSRPDCPACDCPSAADCTTCCDPDFPPAESYTLDLSGFALSAGTSEPISCECGAIDGSVVVDYTGPCTWEYHSTMDCSETIPTEENWYVMLQMVYFPLTMECKWRATIRGLRPFVGDGFSDLSGNVQGNSVFAIYESSALASDEDCQTTPVTLFKQVGEVYYLCDGTLPSSITLDL